MGTTFSFAVLGNVTPKDAPGRWATDREWHAYFVSRGYYDMSNSEAATAAYELAAQGVALDVTPNALITPDTCERIAEAFRDHPDLSLHHLGLFCGIAAAAEHSGVIVE